MDQHWIPYAGMASMLQATTTLILIAGGSVPVLSLACWRHQSSDKHIDLVQTSGTANERHKNCRLLIEVWQFMISKLDDAIPGKLGSIPRLWDKNLWDKNLWDTGQGLGWPASYEINPWRMAHELASVLVLTPSLL